MERVEGGRAGLTAAGDTTNIWGGAGGKHNNNPWALNAGNVENNQKHLSTYCSFFFNVLKAFFNATFLSILSCLLIGCELLKGNWFLWSHLP